MPDANNTPVIGERTNDNDLNVMNEQRKLLLTDDETTIIEKIYQLWWNWADFQLYIVSPTIDVISPPIIISPEPLLNSTELEVVYTIHDYGHMLCTSKSEEMYRAGKSMYRLYLTIEKMIYLLVERLKSSGTSTETEVQVAFGGHELAQRKGFESIINLSYNVVVTNFDPRSWGERYLQTVKRLAEKGFGYPLETPRMAFRQSTGSPLSSTKKKDPT